MLATATQLGIHGTDVLFTLPTTKLTTSTTTQPTTTKGSFLDSIVARARA